MVDPHMLAAERLGGADYDGDMVRTIASPLINQCVRRNYYEYSDKLTNMDNLPLLMIPTIEPLILPCCTPLRYLGGKKNWTPSSARK